MFTDISSVRIDITATIDDDGGGNCETWVQTWVKWWYVEYWPST